MPENSTAGRRLGGRVLLALGLIGGVVVSSTAGSSSAGAPSVGFSKEFVPDTIGPGSTSTLTFTIDNSFSGAVTLEGLAFTDDLPDDVSVADAPAIVNGCAGTLIAAPGSDSIVLTGGLLGADDDCEISVNVTSSVVTVEGGHENETTTLTSETPEDSHGTASDELFVDDALPGFTKSFAPTVIEFGETSRLTFEIDNSAAGSVDHETLDFTDTLPAGLTIADPALATTDCGTATVPPTLTAVPGTAVITLDADGVALFPAIAAEATCTVEVEIVGGAVGVQENVSGDLLVDLETSAGIAVDPIEVTPIEETLALAKEFVDDPAPPGGITTLVFTVTNQSRDHGIDDIAFSDDLDATLSGLEATGASVNTCGGMATSAFPTGLFVYEDGTLPPEGTCTIAIDVLIPSDAALDAHANTAGPATGTLGSVPPVEVESNVAGDLLFVVPFPILVKDFTDDTIGAGDTVTLEFTITNTDESSALSDIEFLDELTDGSSSGNPMSGFLPFPVSVTIPSGDPCGTGSAVALVSAGTDRQALELTGGSLAKAGESGDSCTFSVDVDIPADLGGGTYTNYTEEISATLDDVEDTPTVSGPGGSDDLTVVAAPRLTKEFTDDPAIPGDTVELKFTLENLDPDNAATAIAFSDDLTTVVSGLEAASVDGNTCPDATVDIGTPTMISVFGGSLDPEETCEITLTLDVPSDVAGIYDNETSEVSATVAGVIAKSAAAADPLVVTGLLLTKSFDPDTVIPGEETDITFTLDNIGAEDATSITFSDSLSSILPGTPDIEAVPPLPVAPCGGTISGTTFLLFTGGSVDAGDPPCSFDVTVLVPPEADDGQYTNVTSGVSYDAPTTVTGPPARAELTISKTLIEITKEFTDDPVAPGDPVTLKFSLENLSTTDTVDAIDFKDDLDAALSGLEAIAATTNTCGGMATSTFPTGLFEYEDGTLDPEATCEIVLTVSVPDPPLPGRIFTNTTSLVTGGVGSLEVIGEPASDDLLIRSAELTKSFDGPSSAAGIAELTFEITNLDSSAGQVGLAFSDDLDAVVSGLVAKAPLPTDPCGTGSTLSGTSFLALTGGSLPPSGTCEFTVTVEVPATAPSGDYLNVTSALFASGLPVDDAASAVLSLDNPPFTPIEGKRYADTRSPGGTTFDGLFEGDGRFGPAASYEVDIAGRGDVPLDATGAIINVTAVGPSLPGFVTVHPCEPSPPTASTVNYTAGVDVANEIFAPLSGGGSVCAYTSAEIDLLLDVVGYVSADDSIELMTPGRFADSRGPSTIDGSFEGFGPTAAGSTTKITVAGRGGVPDTGVSAVIANVTAVGTPDDNYLTVFPCLPSVPLASSLNYTAGVDRANELIAQVDAAGDICVYTNSSIHFLVDVSGYVLAGSDLESTDPARFVDTRIGGVTIDGVNAGTGPLAADSTTLVDIADRGDVPADAIAAVVNVAAVDPAAAGFFTVDSCGTPTESSLNYTAGVNGANELVVKLSPTGELCIYTSAVTDVIMDVVGYQMPTPP